MRRLILLVSIFAVVSSGCGLAGAAANTREEIDPRLVETAVARLQASASPTVVSPTPAAAMPPTPLPSLTPTPTPHPLEIRAMRAGSYPGSDIVIEQELAQGSNYRRYYASYLSEGLKIYALLTVPNGEPPPGGWPAIVFNHGYIPPAQYRTTERYVAYVDRLARSDYIVFRIDYRGHDRSEGAPTGAYSDPGYLIDVLNAVSSLQRFAQANPEKIGMWGHSMGGYLTLRAMVISDVLKAGVIWAGVVGSYPDMLERWRRSSGLLPTPRPGSRRWREDWVQRYGSPEQNPEFWSSISANAFLADLSGPLQLHHATADRDVPWEFSQTLFEQVQAAGREGELYLYEGDDHNISGYFGAAMRRTIEFYDRYLK